MVDRKLLSTLDRRDRAIVTRVCLQGETLTQVAKRFRMKRGEVQRRYREALDRLREMAVRASERWEKRTQRIKRNNLVI